jgi:hypothetical protein
MTSPRSHGSCRRGGHCLSCCRPGTAARRWSRPFALRKRTFTVSPRYVQFPETPTLPGWIERAVAWYRGGRGGGGGGGGVGISSVMICENSRIGHSPASTQGQSIPPMWT